MRKSPCGQAQQLTWLFCLGNLPTVCQVSSALFFPIVWLDLRLFFQSSFKYSVPLYYSNCSVVFIWIPFLDVFALQMVLSVCPTRWTWLRFCNRFRAESKRSPDRHTVSQEALTPGAFLLSSGSQQLGEFKPGMKKEARISDVGRSSRLLHILDQFSFSMLPIKKKTNQIGKPN